MRGDGGFPVRLGFSKHGRIRFISHRDVARAFERALRIAQLPVAFTQGFVPRPKVSFGPALGVGYESDAEYLDLELREAVALDDLPDRLSDALPEGLRVFGVVALADRAPSLQEAITCVAYRVATSGAADEALARATTALWASPEARVPTMRKGRPVVEDIRPALRRIETRGLVLDLEVATQPRTPRVTDVVRALRSQEWGTAELREERVVRTHQWIERGGQRMDPLEADRRSAASSPSGAPTVGGLRRVEASA